jgi:hypothetical protein
VSARIVAVYDPALVICDIKAGQVALKHTPIAFFESGFVFKPQPDDFRLLVYSASQNKNPNCDGYNEDGKSTEQQDRSPRVQP